MHLPTKQKPESFPAINGKVKRAVGNVIWKGEAELGMLCKDISHSMANCLCFLRLCFYSPQCGREGRGREPQTTWQWEKNINFLKKFNQSTHDNNWAAFDSQNTNDWCTAFACLERAANNTLSHSELQLGFPALGLLKTQALPVFPQSPILSLGPKLVVVFPMHCLSCSANGFLQRTLWNWLLQASWAKVFTVPWRSL